MRALKIMAEVGADHHMVLDLPESIAPGPAEVIVLVRDEGAQGSKKPLGEVLRRINAQSGGRTAQDIQRQLDEEREGWGA